MKTGASKNLKVFESEWYLESIKTIHNLCEVVFILLNLGRYELLATITELLHVEIQSVSDEYCRKELEDAK